MVVEYEKENWKKFIQINIYGRTLRELEKNGVNLRYLLNDIGCSKCWITEGSVYNSDDSGMDSSFDDTMPIFSTTVANTNFPRSSTPRNSHKQLSRKFTLGTTRVFSEIFSSDDEMEYSNRHIEDDNKIIEEVDCNDQIIIQRLMNEIISEISSTTEHAALVNISDSNHGNVSSEIVYMDNLDHIVDEHNAQLNEQKNIMNTLGRSKSVQPAAETVTVLRNKSDPIVHCKSILIPQEKRKRKRVKRTTSETLNREKKVIKIVNSKSALPMIAKDTPYIQFPTYQNKVDNLLLTQNNLCGSLENMYSDLTPVCPSADSPQECLHDYYNSKQNNAFDDDYMEYGNVENSLDFSAEEWEDAIGFNELAAHSNDETKVIGLYRDVQELSLNNGIANEDQYVFENEVHDNLEEGPSTSVIQTKKASSKQKKSLKAKKKVSFALNHDDVKKPTVYQYEKIVNQMHHIKCMYENCTQEYKWKIKYGKLRLLDHALKHTSSQNITCSICGYYTWTTRQMNHHYNQKHSENKARGFVMKEIFNLAGVQINLKELWIMCYKDQIDIIGEATTDKIQRVKRKFNESDSEAASGAEEPVQNEYF